MQLKTLHRAIFLCLVVMTFQAQAALELIFRTQTRVYGKRNARADVVTVYERGDRVPISRETYGAWKKIVAEVDGKKQIGWVLVRDIKGARIQEKDDEKVITESGERKRLAPVYRRKTGAGFAGVLSYYKQGGGEADLNNVSAPQLKFSGFDGTAVYFSGFADWVVGSTTNLRTFLSLRNLERSGTGTYPPDTTSRTVNLKQTGLSVGATLKLYSNPNGISWWGGGFEVVKASKNDVTSSNISASYKDEPFIFFANASLGYDINIYKNIYILPEFRLGVGINGDPLIINAEVLIPVGFSF